MKLGQVFRWHVPVACHQQTHGLIGMHRRSSAEMARRTCGQIVQPRTHCQLLVSSKLLGVQDLEQGEALVARKLLERDTKRRRLLPFAAGQLRQQSIQDSAVAGKIWAVRAHSLVVLEEQQHVGAANKAWWSVRCVRSGIQHLHLNVGWECPAH